MKKNMETTIWGLGPRFQRVVGKNLETLYDLRFRVHRK